MFKLDIHVVIFSGVRFSSVQVKKYAKGSQLSVMFRSKLSYSAVSITILPSVVQSRV